VPGPGPLRDGLASVATVARNRGLRDLNAGWAGSITGEYLTLTALGVYGFGASGATGVGLIAVAQMLPALLVAPFAALLGDRLRRERVLALTEVVRATASVLAAVAVMSGAGPWAVFVLAGVLGASRTAYYPAQSGLIPLLARHPHEITACAASLNLIKNVANLAAPALAGLLLLWWPLATVFGVAAAAFLASAATAAFRLPSTAGLRAHVRRAGGRRELSRGFAAARRDPSVRTPLALCAAQGLGRGAINVLVILLPLGLLGLGDSGAGFYSALIGLGGIAGVVGSLAVAGRRALAVPMAIGLVAMGAPYLLPALAPVAWAAAAALLVAGFGNGVMGVTGMSLLVRESRDDVLSRIMGVQELLRAGGIIVASLGVPLLSEAVGLRTALVVLGAGLTAWGLAEIPAARRLDGAAREPSPETALLADSLLFRRLLPVALDRVSRRMIRERVEAGRELIREGEVGDRVYLAVEGRFEVTAAGRPLGVLGRGDVFGEIALLGDGLRTATVRAAVPGEVLWLDRGEFLSAVLGHPVASIDARALAGARLARGAASLDDAPTAP
jgi:MFS family permease